MANAEGGYVIVGIHDGAVDGVRRARLNDLRQTAYDFTAPVVRCSATELTTRDDQVLLILRVDPGEHVHETTRGDVYLRVGDESRRLGYAQRRELEYDRGTGAAMTLYEGGDVRCEGSIPEQIARADKMIDEWVPRVQALAPSGRFEPRPIIPRDVWLEGLVNAVLHRSYSMAGDHVRVEIFPNRIEIENPGRFPGLADPSRPLSIIRYARNPRIVRVCSDLGIARELGEGIKRIFGAMRSLGLTDPIYSQASGSVRLVLSSADALPEDVRASLPKAARKVLDRLRLEGRPMSTGPDRRVGRHRPTDGITPPADSPQARPGCLGRPGTQGPTRVMVAALIYCNTDVSVDLSSSRHRPSDIRE